MNAPFNKLSDGEAERLAILLEECAEVIQVVGKILRHGYESTHPDNEDGPTNRNMLETELGHIAAIQKMMAVGHDINPYWVDCAEEAKLESMKPYLHHN